MTQTRTHALILTTQIHALCSSSRRTMFRFENQLKERRKKRLAAVERKRDMALTLEELQVPLS